MYGSAALLHRGIYASVRIRASRDPATGTASPELVKMVPGGARCKCSGGDERRTLPCRRQCCREDCLHDAVDTPLRAAALPRDTHDLPRDAAGANPRTRSLIVVARPAVTNNCPDCHTVSLVANAGQDNKPLRDYGTVTTTA